MSGKNQFLIKFCLTLWAVQIYSAIFCEKRWTRQKTRARKYGRRMFYKTRNPFDRDVTRDKYTKNGDSAVSRINPTTCIQQSVWNTESLQAVFRISCFLYQCFLYQLFFVSVFLYPLFRLSVFLYQLFYYHLFSYLY